MRWAAIAVLLAVSFAGCGGRAASEVSSQAKGWVSRLNRNVRARNKTEISRICDQVHEPRANMTDSELSMFDQVCDYCEDEQWEEAEAQLRVMAGEDE